MYFLYYDNFILKRELRCKRLPTRLNVFDLIYFDKEA